jgi:hypothetical protein
MDKSILKTIAAGISLAVVLLIGVSMSAANAQQPAPTDEQDSQAARQHSNAYFLFQGSYPDEEDTAYAKNFQGLTHDDNNWFLAQTSDLWKIPVHYNLRHIMSDNLPGVIHRTLSDIRTSDGKTLESLGFHHIGDLSYYPEKAYVVAPVEGKCTASEPVCHDVRLPVTGPGYPPIKGWRTDRICTEICRSWDSAIFLFSANDLGYVSHCKLPEYKDLGWVALDPDGVLYTSGDRITTINRYKANWAELPNQPLHLDFDGSITLYDKRGVDTIWLGNTQGGVFSENGELLYMLSGILDESQQENQGINVFDTKTWRRVIRSTTEDDKPSYFHYHFHPGWDQYEEPEGITIWDLDNGQAPGIRGQLHVGMLDNEIVSGDDEIYLYHYGMIHVNRYFGYRETGSPAAPFDTVREASDLAWDGSRITIEAGNYPEALSISRKMELVATGGPVTLGIEQPGVKPEKCKDAVTDFMTPNEHLFTLLSASTASDAFSFAEIRNQLRSGKGLVIFFEHPNFDGHYFARWSHDHAEELWKQRSMDGDWDDEADSFLFFAPEDVSQQLFLHIYEDVDFEDAEIRFCGPSGISDMDELDNGHSFGMGGDEMDSFRFEDR